MGPAFVSQQQAEVIWLGSQLPLCIVCYVGLMVAIGRWRRHPTTSLLTVIGVGILILNSVIWIVMPELSLDLFMGSWVVRLMAIAFGVMFILMAALKKRRQKPVLVSIDDPYDSAHQEFKHPASESITDDPLRKGTKP